MNALRIATQHQVRARRLNLIVHLARPTRTFASTSARRASEDADSFMAGFKNSPIFNQLADKPEAIAALSRMAEYLKKQNVDFSTPPSTMTMFKLASDSEFRELTRQAIAEIRNAGIDLRAENAMELFSPKGPRGPK